MTWRFIIRKIITAFGLVFLLLAGSALAFEYKDAVQLDPMKADLAKDYQALKSGSTASEPDQFPLTALIERAEKSAGGDERLAAEVLLSMADRFLIGRDGTPVRPVKAVEILNYLADKGLPEAWYTVGLLYRDGEVLPANTTLAILWLRAAGLAGLPEALWATAEAYDQGTWLGRDPEKAAYWYRRLADCGDCELAGPAQYRLGELYALGVGGPANRPEADKWFEKAAASGFKAQEK